MAIPMAPRYIYQALGTSTSIRLLHIVPADESAPICSLVEVDLEDATRPAYLSLSYTWGSPIPGGELSPAEAPDHLMLYDPGDDDGRKTCMPIWRNLHNFLTELSRRNRHTETYIWIDAVSINQDDLAERGAQVAIMGRIYASSYLTITWLGPEDPYSKDACRVVDIFADLGKKRNSDPSDTFSPSRDSDSWFWNQRAYAETGVWPSRWQRRERYGIQAITLEDWQSFAQFLDRNWFHRLWTLQEMVLAHRIVFWCGSREYKLGPLTEAMYVFRWDGLPQAIRQDELIETATEEGTFPQRVAANLTTLLHGVESRSDGANRRPLSMEGLARSRRCLKPHDKVYGVMSLWKGESQQRISYEESIADVFTDFVMASGFSALVPFRVEARRHRQLATLPSWLPDLTVPLRPGNILQSGGTGVHAAGGERNMLPRLSHDRRLVTVLGIVVDQVSTVVGDYSTVSTGDFFVDSLKFLDGLPDRTEGQRDLLESFWRALVADAVFSRHATSKTEGSAVTPFWTFYLAKWLSVRDAASKECRTLQETLNRLQRKDSTNTLPSWQELLDTAVKFHAYRRDGSPVLTPRERIKAESYAVPLELRLKDRCFFVTDNNRIGIGPDDLEPGISVCVLEGCDYPVFLEEVQGGKYRLAGYGYVEGIMGGEGLARGTSREIVIE